MSTDAVIPLRHRMIEDMNARKLSAGTQRGHIHSCKRFSAFLSRSPGTATTEDIRRFQLHLAKAGVSICNCNRNRIMTGLRFLFRVTLRRLDLAGEIYHIREPQKFSHALAGPPQGRFGIPTRRRFDQCLEIAAQARIFGNRRFAPASRPPNPPRGLVLRQFL